MKICCQCKEEKEIAEFNNDKNARDKHSRVCKQCNRLNNKIWVSKNKERRNAYQRKRRSSPKGKALIKKYYRTYAGKYPQRNIERKLRKLYGIGIAEKEAMRLAQNNKCAVCSREFTSLASAKVDHDHKTGKVRALLCHYCNTLVGFMREDVEALQNAIAYLTEHLDTTKTRL